jgi:DNA-directed RNA polymerase alpha subunit
MPQSSRTGLESEPDGPLDPLLTNCLPQWVARSLEANGIRRLSEASELTDGELLKLRGVGHRSVKLIRAAIRSLKRQRKLTTRH